MEASWRRAADGEGGGADHNVALNGAYAASLTDLVPQEVKASGNAPYVLSASDGDQPLLDAGGLLCDGVVGLDEQTPGALASALGSSPMTSYMVARFGGTLGVSYSYLYEIGPASSSGSYYTWLSTNGRAYFVQANNASGSAWWPGALENLAQVWTSVRGNSVSMFLTPSSAGSGNAYAASGANPAPSGLTRLGRGWLGHIFEWTVCRHGHPAELRTPFIDSLRSYWIGRGLTELA